MRAAVIIRCKDESAFIGKTLEGVFSQKTDAHIEVIVIDSGSTDGTLGIARRFPCRVVEIPPESFGYGYTMNMGARLTDADALIYLSAHCPPVDELWLDGLLAPLSDATVAGCFGRQMPLPGVNPFEEWRFARAFPAGPVHPQEHMFSSASASVRRTVWERLPFDESLPFSEDREWAKRSAGRGMKVVYVPESRVYHVHRFSMQGVRERAYAAGWAKKKIYGRACKFDSRLWVVGAYSYCVARDFVHFAANAYWGYMRYILKYRVEELAGFYQGALDYKKAAIKA